VSDERRVRLVYRPKSPAEAHRRELRTKRLVGTPFLQLPGKPAQHRVLFTTSEGHKARVSDVEMVFNDAAIIDSVSNWGEDGPLYKDTLDTPVMRELYDYAVEAFARVDLPAQLRKGYWESNPI
jgi:hypothetical protein